MKKTEIECIKATTKEGLRYRFAIVCLDSNIPLNILQKWFGDTSPTTTPIYANALCQEGRNIASLLWERKSS